MDKLQPFIKFLKRHHFWLLTGLFLVVAVASWYLTKSDLSAEFEANRSTFASKVSEQQALASAPVHPNDDVIAGDRRQTEILRDRVRRIWRELYARQQREVLRWPEALGSDFGPAMQKHNFGDEISSNLRSRYRNYIERRVKELPAMVNALELPEGQNLALFGAATSERGSDPVIDEDYWLIWRDYPAVREMFNIVDVPESIEVWIYQENLWVYENLLRTINNVNVAKEPTGPHNSAVREIISLEVGQPAAAAMAQSAQRIFIPREVQQAMAATSGGGSGYDGGYAGGYGGAGAGGVGPPPGAGSGYDGGYSGGYGGGYGGTGEAPDRTAMLLTGRYVDEEGQPLAADLESIGIEYKRIPVRLTLKMDQRWLLRLMVECANADLPVEIQQTQVIMTNDSMGPAGGGGTGSGYGGSSGGGYDGGYSSDGGGYSGGYGSGGGAGRPPSSGSGYDGGYSSGGAGGYSGGSGYDGGYGASNFGIGYGDSTDAAKQKPEPYLATVVLHGVVYIYNKPQADVLELPWSTEGSDPTAQDVVRDAAITDGTET